MNLLKNSALGIKKTIVEKIFCIRYPEINKIFTHLTFGEKSMLMQLAEYYNGSIYVEIGSYLGASSCCIAEGIRKSRNEAKLFCVDTWENDSMSEGKIDTYQKFKQNTKHYRSIIHPLQGWSGEVVHSFNERVDFLFIDGGHSYDEVKKDVDLWIPKLNPGALLVLHDIGWAEGVQRVVREDISPRAKREGRLPNMYWAWL